MYRTPSGEETKLASAIRKHTSGPCWPREDDSISSSETSADKPASGSEIITAQIETK